MLYIYRQYVDEAINHDYFFYITILYIYIYIYIYINVMILFNYLI